MNLKALTYKNYNKECDCTSIAKCSILNITCRIWWLSHGSYLFTYDPTHCRFSDKVLQESFTVHICLNIVEFSWLTTIVFSWLTVFLMADSRPWFSLEGHHGLTPPAHGPAKRFTSPYRVLCCPTDSRLASMYSLSLQWERYLIGLQYNYYLLEGNLSYFHA